MENPIAKAGKDNSPELRFGTFSFLWALYDLFWIGAVAAVVIFPKFFPLSFFVFLTINAAFTFLLFHDMQTAHKISLIIGATRTNEIQELLDRARSEIKTLQKKQGEAENMLSDLCLQSIENGAVLKALCQQANDSANSN